MHLQTNKTSLNLLVFLLSLLFFEIHLYDGIDVLEVGQTLSGNKTISSENGTFELGFFTPGKSQNYYIGIWYRIFDTKTVVWVANRNDPISDPYNSELKLFPNGNLALINEARIQIWSSNSTSTTDNSTLAILLDNGNFVTRDNQDSSNVIWQSFDYPTDTWLPGGKIGYNKIKKEKIYLTTWRSSENPASGIFSFEVETYNKSEILVYNKSRQYWSSGAWTGTSFALVPEIGLNTYISNLTYISNVNESIFTYDIAVPKSFTRFMVHWTGQLRQLVWREDFPERQWLPYSVWPQQCEGLGLCGDFAKCNQLAEPYCNCFHGYEPRDSKNWVLGHYADGCMKKSARASKTRVWIVLGATGGSFILLGMVTLSILQLRKQKMGSYDWESGNLMFFKYQDIKNSTMNFSEKIGEGGFGSVYKGTLPNSRAIAVKRLNNLYQGEKQFRTEMSTIGQIHHINLVRLRGFCIEGEKRLLVFDYMKNGSLENYLFRENFNVFLDWKARYKIMIGIARGLGYLHEKCRDCIIHCDIKPDNILLDDEFNAKVADFGLAKLLGREYSHVLTTIKGTRGYMAPEWMSNEAITEKVDVYSYGKLLFEIISGRRNMEFLDDGNYFPALVAEEVSEGEEGLMQFLDKRLKGEANSCELARACKVACWCIQDDEKIRPSMGDVIQILEGHFEVNTPPIPQFLLGFTNPNNSQPEFYQNYSFSITSSTS
ncbi:G-type lectin S-receptor-like serine/threonine-protein kinase At2g19130 [Apium graveolens]|uniref:G-type lectin S-receptor-like serine/threonine-protein kinase At2g19130 n=1 Tax=Apium graveolens TaxID=4045 RepID=UPI003D7B1C57